MSNLPVYPSTPLLQLTKISSADGVSDQTILNAQANGARVDSIFITSSEPSNVNVTLKINDGVQIVSIVGDITIPANSGFGGNPGVELLVVEKIPLLQKTDDSFFLPNNASLIITPASALTTGVMSIVVMGGAY